MNENHYGIDSFFGLSHGKSIKIMTARTPSLGKMDAQAPVSSGLAQRKQPERLFSQAVSPKVQVLKQICDLRAKRHTTATGAPLRFKQSIRKGAFFVGGTTISVPLTPDAFFAIINAERW